MTMQTVATLEKELKEVVRSVLPVSLLTAEYGHTRYAFESVAQDLDYVLSKDMKDVDAQSFSSIARHAYHNSSKSFTNGEDYLGYLQDLHGNARTLMTLLKNGQLNVASKVMKSLKENAVAVKQLRVS